MDPKAEPPKVPPIPLPPEPPPAEGAPETGKKKKKKPKLSKAEKKRLRAIAAMELKKRLMKEQLLRELAMTKKSTKRGNDEWELICREIKVKELRQEMQKLGREVGRLLRRRDDKIHSLIKSMDETAEMSERSFSQFLDQLEYLENCYDMLRNTSKELYDERAIDLIQDFYEELDRHKGVFDAIKLHSENIIHTTNVSMVSKLKKHHDDYLDTLFGEVCTEVENRYVHRNKIVKYMEGLQQNLLNFIKVLQGDLVDVNKTANYLHFMQRQKAYVIESRKLNEIERQSLKTISDLENKLLQIETDLNRKMFGLKMERTYFMTVRANLKEKIEKNESNMYEELLQLSSEGYDLLKQLKEFVTYGEHLLGLVACCRKFQTEKEKVLPFHPLVTDAELPRTSTDEHKQIMNDIANLLEISEEELEDEMRQMTNFWHRCSIVRYQSLLLRKEKAELVEESEKLQNIVRSMKNSYEVEDIKKAMIIKQSLV